MGAHGGHRQGHGPAWWPAPRRWGAMTVLALPGLLVTPVLTPGATALTEPTGPVDSAPVPVIVREAASAGRAPEAAVRAAGGAVDRRLGIVRGFSATVPAAVVPALRTAPGVLSVTVDASLQLSAAHHGVDGAHADEVQTYAAQPTSMAAVAQRVTGAADLWSDGITGRGVDVALIDSGVVPVDGLSGGDKVWHGPDLSFEANDCTSGACVPSPARHLDSFGHGTHMAGIIAGRDAATPGPVRAGDSDHFLGMAPDARIVSVKVADANGATDVSQVIAAIDWVVRNRKRDGLNIRVLNLSFGTDGVQDYQLDPLAHAAEVAWHRGIVVVVAAGNDGYGSAKLNNPAYDPWVLAVGATDGRGTDVVADDVVPAWSSTGDGTRNPDLVAPGTSVLSLRDPGSFVDTTHPDARFGSRFFRGSGTSQAAAVVAGAAALLVQQRPDATPDQVKALLTRTAQPLPASGATAQGAGLVDLRAAGAEPTPRVKQHWPRSRGTGSLEAARGSHHVLSDGEPVIGEVDVAGHSWTGNAWFARIWAGHSWTGHSWTGHSWTGHSWTGHSWTGHSWTGHSWTGHSWTGHSWTGHSWTGHSWTGHSWSSAGWPGEAARR